MSDSGKLKDDGSFTKESEKYMYRRAVTLCIKHKIIKEDKDHIESVMQFSYLLQANFSKYRPGVALMNTVIAYMPDASKEEVLCAFMFLMSMFKGRKVGNAIIEDSDTMPSVDDDMTRSDFISSLKNQEAVK